MDAAKLERSCTSKVRYPSPLIAEGVAATRGHQSDVNLRVYACRHCAGYHLTSLYARALLEAESSLVGVIETRQRRAR